MQNYLKSFHFNENKSLECCRLLFFKNQIEKRTFLFPSRHNLFIDLYSVSYFWYTPIAVGSVILVGNIVSHLTHPLQPHEIDPKLIIPIVDLCCGFLPKRRQEWLPCGIDYEVNIEEKVFNSSSFYSCIKRISYRTKMAIQK